MQSAFFQVQFQFQACISKRYLFGLFLRLHLLHLLLGLLPTHHPLELVHRPLPFLLQLPGPDLGVKLTLALSDFLQSLLKITNCELVNNQGRDRTTKCGSTSQNQDTGYVFEEPQKVSLVWRKSIF